MPALIPPSDMRAATIIDYNKPLEIRRIPIPVPTSNQILVKVLASSLCNSDLAGWMGVVGAKAPYCGGHEPVGVIASVGESVQGFAVGDRVGFMPASFTCRKSHPAKTPVGFNGPYGGFSEYCIADPLSTIKIPQGLTNEVAAPLLCAGVTAYGALRKVAQSLPGGNSINIIGAGGVGHLVIKYARAMGYHVRAYDVAEDKLALATASGANEAHNSMMVDPTDSSLHCAATVVASGAAPAYDLAFKITKCHGRVIAVGVPRGDIQVNLLTMIRNDLSLIATNQGSKQELKEALEIAALHQISPVYEMRELEQINEGYQSMVKGEISGRLVYRMG